jgi:hypothetical protein
VTVPPIFASRSALDQAARLLDRPLENLVAEAIDAGKKRSQPPRGLGLDCLPPEQRLVFLRGNRIAAVIERTESRFSGRKAWKVLRLVHVPR